MYCLFTTCWESEYDCTDSNFPTYGKLTVCSLGTCTIHKGGRLGPEKFRSGLRSSCGSKAEKAEKKSAQNFLDCTPSQETFCAARLQLFIFKNLVNYYFETELKSSDEGIQGLAL